LLRCGKSIGYLFMMTSTAFRALIAAIALVAACGDDEHPADLSVVLDQSVAVDQSMPPPDLSMQQKSGDGGFINADGGANCGATFDYATRYVAGRTCSTNSGGAAGASCTASTDCAEVCCTCAGNSNKYMVALCSDHMCNPDWACLCTDVADKLKADNVCP
jgi:hypothetical protein